MRSVLVFILWVFVSVIGYFLLFIPWFVFVSLPRVLWSMYRGTGPFEKDWETPWFLLAIATRSVRNLDPNMKDDI